MSCGLWWGIADLCKEGFHSLKRKGANSFPSLWGEYSLSFIISIFYMTSVTYKRSDLENRVLEKVECRHSLQRSERCGKVKKRHREQAELASKRQMASVG